MRTTKLILLAGLLGFAIAQAALAQEVLNPQAFIRDFDNNQVNGLEVVMPVFDYTDGNFDGYPDSVLIKFNVYTAGTSTLLYSTQPQTITLPPLPGGCAPSDAHTDFPHKLKALISSTSNRVYLAMDFKLECNGVTTYKTAVYSTNPSGAGAASWKRGYDGLELLSAGGIDTSVPQDGVNDVFAVGMAYAVTGGQNHRIVTLNPSTGAEITNIGTYPYIR